jgi:hypothetical protein
MSTGSCCRPFLVEYRPSLCLAPIWGVLAASLWSNLWTLRIAITTLYKEQSMIWKRNFFWSFLVILSVAAVGCGTGSVDFSDAALVTLDLPGMT